MTWNAEEWIIFVLLNLMYAYIGTLIFYTWHMLSSISISILWLIDRFSLIGCSNIMIHSYWLYISYYCLITCTTYEVKIFNFCNSQQSQSSARVLFFLESRHHEQWSEITLQFVGVSMTICIFKGRFWVEYFRNISLFYIYFLYIL